ncbi:MAG: glycosyltransferase [Candidatus Altiarchaeales archaeon]|nr:glycosyltransferase [Candidatus Altiarchaeales archaeon]
MKIGFFTDTYYPQVNGVTFTVESWAKELAKKHEVKVFYPESSHTPKPNEYPIKSVDFRFYRGYRSALPFVDPKKTDDLDVVHVHGLFGMALSALNTSRRNHCPAYLTYHTPFEDYMGYITKKRIIQKPLISLYNLWEKHLMRRFNLITVPSKVMKKHLIEKGDPTPKVLSNGIDTELFSWRDPEEFLYKHQIPPKLNIGFCGRFGYEKHLEELIYLSAELDANILLAGSGPAEKYYMDLARGRGNVKFLGFIKREELAEFYSALDVFVFPSTAETQGLVALEAMACGTPVVGAKKLALEETILDGKTGFHYRLGDRKQLMEKIRQCLKREDFPENCRNEARKHSIENTVKKLLEIYDGKR